MVRTPYGSANMNSPEWKHSGGDFRVYQQIMQQKQMMLQQQAMMKQQASLPQAAEEGRERPTFEYRRRPPRGGPEGEEETSPPGRPTRHQSPPRRPRSRRRRPGLEARRRPLETQNPPTDPRERIGRGFVVRGRLGGVRRSGSRRLGAGRGEGEVLAVPADLDHAVGEVAPLQEEVGQGIGDPLLDDPLQGAGAVGGVEPLVGQLPLGLVVDVDRQAGLGQLASGACGAGCRRSWSARPSPAGGR